MSKTMKKPPSEALSKDREINPKIFIHSAVILEFVELSSKEDEFLFLIGCFICGYRRLLEQEEDSRARVPKTTSLQLHDGRR